MRVLRGRSVGAAAAPPPPSRPSPPPAHLHLVGNGLGRPRRMLAHRCTKTSAVFPLITAISL